MRSGYLMHIERAVGRNTRIQLMQTRTFSWHLQAVQEPIYFKPGLFYCPIQSPELRLSR